MLFYHWQKKNDKIYLLQDDNNKLESIAIARIQNFDKLDAFINAKRPDTSLIIVTSDVWNEMGIHIINSRNDTIG